MVDLIDFIKCSSLVFSCLLHLTLISNAELFIFVLCKKNEGIQLTHACPSREDSLFLTILFFYDIIRTIVQIAQPLIEAPCINPKEDEEIPNITKQQIKAHDEQSEGHRQRSRKQNRHRWRADIAACVLT